MLTSSVQDQARQRQRGLNVWLIHMGEPLPIDGPVRLHRYGQLAPYLVAEGHQVTHWAPTFNHFTKSYRFQADTEVAIQPHHTLQCLHAGGYARNISLRRIRFHNRAAQKFLQRAKQLPRPDIIVCSMPTPELCEAALKFGRHAHCPVVIDVRDLWPDVYLTVVPPHLRTPARWAMSPLFHTNRTIFKRAAAIFAVSSNYLAWGLNFAERDTSPLDGLIPHAYPKADHDSAAVAQAKAALTELGVDSTQTLCLFIGQFGASYDLATVIGAARILKAQGIDNLQFILCGDGTKRAALEAAAQDLNNVIFTGWVSQPTIAALLELASIGLAAYSPSALQSIPNKPIEYCAGGLPVVSSLAGELKTLMAQHECGRSYQPGSAQGLADAIRFYHTNPAARLAAGRNAHALYQAQFTPEAIFPGFIQRLEQIVAHEREGNPRHG